MPGLLLTYSSDDVRCYIGIIFNVYRILSGLGECKYMQGSLLIIYDLHGLKSQKRVCVEVFLWPGNLLLFLFVISCNTFFLFS